MKNNVFKLSQETFEDLRLDYDASISINNFNATITVAYWARYVQNVVHAILHMHVYFCNILEVKFWTYFGAHF